MSQRVRFMCGQIHGLRTARKRFQCSGHLAPKRHFIEPGDRYVASALPPASDIGNPTWLHGTLCLDCAPVEYAEAGGPPRGTRHGRRA